MTLPLPNDNVEMVPKHQDLFESYPKHSTRKNVLGRCSHKNLVDEGGSKGEDGKRLAVGEVDMLS